jgi:acyl carrier protein
MTQDSFYTELEELLELEGELESNQNTLIEDVLEIDSLAHITIISFIKDELGAELKAEDFAKFETLGDLVKAIGVEKLQ